jgi:hypothetical protein
MENKQPTEKAQAILADYLYLKKKTGSPEKATELIRLMAIDNHPLALPVWGVKATHQDSGKAESKEQ